MTDRQVTAALAGSATVATTAPPIRQSQPWRWVLHTAQLDLYADPDGQLSREETLVTCGGAVHRALIALAADGLAVRIDLLPERELDPHHVATLTPTGPIEVTPEARTLAETAVGGARSMPAPPISGALRPLADAARAQGAYLRVLDAAEVRRLAAATPLLPRSARTGVGRDDTTRFAVLYGDQATDEAWLRAGQALSAVDLGAARAGLNMVASTTAVDLSSSREVLRQLLPAGTTPYLALRLGPAAATVATRPRGIHDERVREEP